MSASLPRRTGFTIIEVMLFLAISGALTIGVLASASAGINSQRYRDALNSLQSLLQEQYNQTAHVVNDRGATKSCGASGIRDENPQPQGTSDCVVLGRYVGINQFGTEIERANIVGLRTDFTDVSTDTAALTQYRMSVDQQNLTSSSTAWGGEIRPRTGSSPMTIPSGQVFIVAILRSPLSGSIRTYSYVGAPRTITTGQLDQANQMERHLCMDANNFVVGSRLGVTIAERASSGAAIEIRPESDRLCS